MTSRYVVGLEQALRDIDLDIQNLQEKRTRIVQLIDDEKQPARHENVTPIHRQRPWLKSRANPFEADPNSLASRRLAAAARYLEESGRTEATFLEVYEHLPHELNGSTKAREGFRSAIQTSGKRAGLAYEKRPTGPVVKRLKPSA